MDNGLRYRLHRRKEAGTLIGPIRQGINEALVSNGFDGNGRFRSLGEAVNRIHGILSESAIEIADIVDAWGLVGDKGHKTYNLQFITDDPFRPEEIRNSMLVFSWYFHGEESYEVLVYLS
jgi:hypothetical protein